MFAEVFARSAAEVSVRSRVFLADALKDLEPRELASAGVLGLIGFRLVAAVRASRRPTGRHVVSAVLDRLSWRHVRPLPLVLGAVLAASAVLVLLPGLGWGWWGALGGEGNATFGSSSDPERDGVRLLVPFLFTALLVPALPWLAYREERWFRMGAENWTTPRRVLKVLQFGVLHALVGIPLGSAVALSIAGAYFMWSYLRTYRLTESSDDATIEASAAHTAYNAVILAVVVASLLLFALGV